MNLTSVTIHAKREELKTLINLPRTLLDCEVVCVFTRGPPIIYIGGDYISLDTTPWTKIIYTQYLFNGEAIRVYEYVPLSEDQ